MKLSEMKTVTSVMAELLEADEWTVTTLASATPKNLVDYRGIGKVTAGKILAEAIEINNRQGLDDSDRLDTERYYQKTPPAKMLADWKEAGLLPQDVALSTARGLAALKGIDEPLALRLISAAQDIVNREKLYEAGRQVVYGGPVKETSAAFDERWLSGEVEPPPMSIRVKRNFDQAKAAYEAANG